MAAPPIDLSAGLVPQQGGMDLSAGLVPKDLSSNPSGQGTYKMIRPGSKGPSSIPYGNVQAARDQGYMFMGGDDARYKKDSEYAQKGSATSQALSQFLAATPLPTVAAVLSHPIDAAESLPSTLKAAYADSKAKLQEANDFRKQGSYGAVGVDALEAVPGIGGYLEHQMDNYDPNDTAANNAARMGGYLAGNLATVAATEGAGKGVAKIVPEGLPARLYGSVLKPSTTLSPAERAALIQTGLDNSIPISEKGAAKLAARVDDLNDKVGQVIATNPNAPIDPQAVATRVDQLRPRMASQVNAAEDLQAIENAKQQFLQEQGAKLGTPAIPPQPTGLYDAQGNPIMSAGLPATAPIPAPPMNAVDAQAMKRGTYTSLGNKAYGELKGANIEGQKALARGLKEELATQFPELNSLNAQEGRLLDLQPVLEKAINRHANHQLLGIGTPIAGAAGAAIGGGIGSGATAMFLKGMLDDPTVKARLAIALSKGAKIPYAQALARVAAYSSLLGANADATSPTQDDQTMH